MLQNLICLSYNFYIIQTQDLDLMFTVQLIMALLFMEPDICSTYLIDIDIVC